MNNDEIKKIEKYKKSQIELASKMIFEQDKEVLRELLKTNMTMTIDSIKIAMEFEKALHIVETQRALIDKLLKNKK